MQKEDYIELSAENNKRQCFDNVSADSQFYTVIIQTLFDKSAVL